MNNFEQESKEESGDLNRRIKINFNFENRLCHQCTYDRYTFGHNDGDWLEDLTENDDRLIDIPPRDHLDHDHCNAPFVY